MKVTKSGRTTETTQGVVKDIDFDIEVDYPALGSIVFEDQILILPREVGGTFSDKGDSGALVITDDSVRSPVGLLFASSSRGTVASHIDRVLSRLDVDDEVLEFA